MRNVLPGAGAVSFSQSAYLPELTDRERAALKGVVRGLSNKEIGRELGLAGHHQASSQQSFPENARPEQSRSSRRRGLSGKGITTLSLYVSMGTIAHPATAIFPLFR